MNTKALIATLLVIGSSTVALADPIVRDHRDSDEVQAPARVEVRDHRNVDKDMDARRRLPVWSVLSANDRLWNGRAKLDVSSWRTLSELQIRVTRGSLEIEKIQIKFTDGDVQTFAPDQILGGAQSPSLTVQLSGRDRVKSIVVSGRGNRRSSFEILGA
ncbi:MAG: hypothetical protein ACM31C_16545 [Acidobacteriota bacterium]